MKLAIDWVALAVIASAYVFGRLPGVNPRLGYGAMALALAFVAFRFWQRGTEIQFNLVMMGVAGAFALYNLFKAFTARPRVAPRPEDD